MAVVLGAAEEEVVEEGAVWVLVRAAQEAKDVQLRQLWCCASLAEETFEGDREEMATVFHLCPARRLWEASWAAPRTTMIRTASIP